MKPLVEAYAYLGTDCDKLQCQSQVAKNMHQAELSSVTVENVMEKLVQMQCAFPDLVKFCQVVLTIPVSSASAERSFSTTKRVENYLHSKMSDVRSHSLHSQHTAIYLYIYNTTAAQ